MFKYQDVLSTTILNSSLTSMIQISGTVDDEEIKRALDKTRETSGDFNLARAIDILLGKCREAAFL